MGQKILDVGQCGFDGPRLRKLLHEKLKVEVECAGTLKEALAMTGKKVYDLVLVNRILNEDRSPGLAVIDALRKEHPKIKIMMISDYPHAQEEAMTHGAIQGFGKAMLHHDETVELLKNAIIEHE